MRLAADRLADPRTLSYASGVYGAHGSVRMASTAGHAYMGYINLGLGMLRRVDPNTKHAALHDRVTTQLAARLFRARTGLIETYPGEVWPPDVAAVAGSIGLHGTATGKDWSNELSAWAGRFRECAIDESGLLIQRVAPGGCRPVDQPRGSGSAVGSYFLSFASPALSAELYGAVQAHSHRVLGFAGVREYRFGHEGSGDGNSGPVLLGVTVGATGFAIGAARANGDRDGFIALTRTASLFGVAGVGADGGFASGGLLGNALLLAMLTAGRA